ncbi:succinate--CoA ligase subunit alpha [Synechocystis sp. PCC 7509]|uniref:succinate--CoA ligase subunit alpha n=1 Tax=Synechocystis sp. PCC 7509 TaxID=927677 RepID=UPI0002AC2BC4|nr:succinate--CoA ligase subunit alpha [Synechocystis sp. PCC 7509]
MNLQPDSKILFQGITAELCSTHGALMKIHGTNLVAGVNPGLGGQTFDDIPVFDLVEQAVAKVGAIDTTLIFVPAYQALDAALEAMSAGIKQIIIVSSGMPPLDMVHLLRKAEATETIIVGPNSPGIIVPGKLLLGTHRSEFYMPGEVGIVSRSSTLTYEIALELTKAGLGQSMAVSIGGDAIAGSSFLQWLQIFDEDEATSAIVLVGEIGGNSEEAAAQYIAETIDKPVIAYIAGRKAPAGRHWGHTGTLAAVVGRGGDVGTAQSKLAAFKAAKVPIAEKPSQIPELVKKVLKIK